jgi:hypothetical protein
MLHATVGVFAGRYRPRGRFGTELSRDSLSWDARQTGNHGHTSDLHDSVHPHRGVATGLTTYPPPVTHLGKVQGTSGTLTLPVPRTATCSFQADVKLEVTGTSTFVLYSSTKAVVPGCGGSATRFTPGYWKNHEAATTALLPQSLGGYTVSTFAQAVAVFDAMKCSDAVNCLAGHLLAAQLDVANGSSTCIAGTISDANAFLTSVGYAGPASYTITASQRAQALSLEQTLDNYTNDSTSSTC